MPNKFSFDHKQFIVSMLQKGKKDILRQIENYKFLPKFHIEKKNNGEGLAQFCVPTRRFKQYSHCTGSFSCRREKVSILV